MFLLLTLNMYLPAGKLTSIMAWVCLASSSFCAFNLMSSWYCLHVFPSCITLHTIQLRCLHISHLNWFTSSSYKHHPLQSGVRQWKLFEECSAWLILFCKCFSNSSSDNSYNKPLLINISDFFTNNARFNIQNES